MTELSDIKNCPDCGQPVKNYIGDGMIRKVCSKKCKGWKVIEEFNIRERMIELNRELLIK